MAKDLGQVCKTVENEWARDGDVEAGANADHGDFHHLVNERPRFLGHTGAFVAEEDHGSRPSGFQHRAQVD